MKTRLLLIPILLLAASCGHDSGLGLTSRGSDAYESADYAYDKEQALALESEMLPEADAPVPQADKKIIKTGRMGLDVKEVKSAKAEIDKLVAAHHGYYASENYNDGDYRSTYTLSVRIPGGSYEAFIAGLESGPGKVTYKEINARDVTEEFIDVETRLANKRSYLQRYRELLKKASTIKEILEVEEQIRQLEEEIESAEGRLRYLSDQVSYSTLDITVTQHKEYKYTSPKSENFWEKTKGAISGGWNILKYILLVIIRLWPIWLLGGGVFLVIHSAQKRRRKKKERQ